MFTNLSLFTRFFVVWFIIGKVRSDIYVTKITRDFNDIFTNGFCGKCGEFAAKQEGNLTCRCNASRSSRSIFMRSERKCKAVADLPLFKNIQERCLLWDNGEAVELIDVDGGKDEYIFRISKATYRSCQVTQFIAFLDAAGKWKSSNISATVLQLLFGVPKPLESTIKVTNQSAVLTKLSGYVMKLSLNCTRRDDAFEARCLIFKLAKGELEFPLCNYLYTTTCATQPLTTTTGTPSTTTGTPCMTTVTPSTTTVTPSTTTTTRPGETPEDPTPFIVVIATFGAILCLLLIGVFVFMACYCMRLQSRNQPRRELENFAVINNSVPQTYRVQEPLYVELPDVCPSNTQFAGGVGERKHSIEVEESVVLNPYAKGASFTRGRLLTDPLPSRPEIEENARIESSVDHAYQNDRHKLHRQRDLSIVLENPQAQEGLSGSFPGSRGVDHLPETRVEEEEPNSELHHHHHEAVDGDEDHLDYQGLMKGKRAQSMFICPSCNENPDYQRLSRPGNCPHERTEERRQKSVSFYESLSHERAARDSLYARPSRDGELQDGDKRKMDGTPEYATLEPEETEANQGLNEPDNHDYNVLEEPEQLCSEADEDKNSEPPPTGEDPEIPAEPSGFVSMDDNPAYALPWKNKDSEEPVRKRSHSM